jgi:hypothetical protein
MVKAGGRQKTHNESAYKTGRPGAFTSPGHPVVYSFLILSFYAFILIEYTTIMP